MVTEEKSMLVRLSDACQKHGLTHQAGRSDDDTAMPESCKRDLKALQAILPKVEKEYRGENARPSDIAHLCDFYDDALTGGFCPYAPNLFRWGRSETDLFHRVQYLLNHLISKRIIQASFKTPALVEKICNTIAQLLSFEWTLQQSIGRDLIRLCFDLSVVIQAKLLDTNDSVSLAIFTETVGVSDYTLDVPSTEALVALQWGSVRILRDYASHLRLRHTDVNLDVSRSFSSRFVDALYDPLLENDMTTNLLASLRQILLAETQRSTPKSCAFLFLAKTDALEVLKSLMYEWQQKEHFSAYIWHPVTLTVARTVLWFFNYFAFAPKDFRSQFAKLLWNFIRHTWLPLHNQFPCGCHPLVLTSLLDCIGDIPDILSEADQDMNELCHLVLRTIDILQTPDGKLETSHCSTNGIFPLLFELLTGPRAIQGAALLLIRHFIYADGPHHAFDLLSSTCQVVLPYIKKPLVQDSSKAPVKTPPSNDRKRKRASMLQRVASPRKLQLERSPKKARSEANLATPSPEESPASDNVGILHNAISLPDSLALFVTKAIKMAYRTFEMAMQGSLADSLEDEAGSFCRSIATFSSLVLLFQPMLVQMCEGSSSAIDKNNIAMAAAFFLECCSDLSNVLIGVWRRSEQGSVPSTIAVELATEMIADLGLVCHVSLRCSRNRISEMLGSSLSNFLGDSSKCVWSVLSFLSSGRTISTQQCRCCSKCCSIVRLLNEEGYHSCLCTITQQMASKEPTFVNEFIDMLPNLPCTIKSVFYSYVRPLEVKHSQTRKELEQMSKVVMKKFENIVVSVSSSHNSSETVSQFIGAILALAPVLITSCSRDVCHLFSSANGSREGDGMQELTDTLKNMCKAFPHAQLSSIWSQSSISSKLRVASLIGIEHYISIMYLCSTGLKGQDFGPLSECKYLMREDPFREKSQGQEIHPALLKISQMLRSSLLFSPYEEEIGLSAADKIRIWRIYRDLFISSSEGGESEPSERLTTVLSRMFSIPFSDSDYIVRLALSRDFGKMMLKLNGKAIRLAFGKKNANEAASDDTLVLLNHEIDRLLFRFSFLSPSQLSSTFTPSTRQKCAVQNKTMFEYQHTAVRAMASLCQFADSGGAFNEKVFAHALLRLVRFWTRFDEVFEEELVQSRGSASAIAFYEMMRLVGTKCFSLLHCPEIRESLVTPLFCEILQPAAGSLVGDEDCGAVQSELCERQDILLYTFIESFMLSVDSSAVTRENIGNRHESFVSQLYASEVVNFVDEALHFVVPSVILDEDYDLLRLVVGFKLFALGIHSSSVSDDIVDVQVGSSIRACLTSPTGLLGRQDLEKQTQLLCISTEMLGSIMPKLFLDKKDRMAPLKFFLEVVVRGAVKLQDIMKTADRKILMGIVSELGRCSHEGRARELILRAATAVAREKVTDAKQGSGVDELAMDWITRHFMFLLVNIVQKKWQQKTLFEQIRALRGLALMLDFLHPKDAPQYLTQMVAIVTSASAQDATRFEEWPMVWTIRELAAKCIAGYIGLLLKDKIDMIGQNLPEIVVSLFPLLVPGETQGWCDSPYQEEARKIQDEAGRKACDLLELLTSGENGEKLSRFFREIPFLPFSPLLDKVRENLKSHGVEFHGLLVVARTQNYDRILSGKDSTTTDCGGTDASTTDEAANGEMISSLQERLRTVRPLLSHESNSVRVVALLHLIDLLSSNRGLFCSLVELEDLLSSSTFLTVRYPKLSVFEGRGSVTALIETIFARMASETTSRKERTLLGTCMGEISAIDPLRLGIMKTVTKGGSREMIVDGATQVENWIYAQPPWQSSTKEYALHLITRLLANALKAASTSTEQHKVGHTIQQLLAMLDVSPVTPELEMSVSGARGRGQMSQWLRDCLSEAGVLETIETYWGTRFEETEGNVGAKLPPFFRNAETYFQWLSRFCRHLILCAHDQCSTEWQRLIYACRVSVRSFAGIGVAEFLLPLLVLERLCFGSSVDEAAILQELRDVFDTSAQCCMTFSERQKVTNTSFLLLDTFKLWSENEIENLQKIRSKHVKDLHRQASSGDWSQPVSMEKISDLAQALPLDTLAEAASVMGMDARSLQLLEAHARSRLAARIFDSTTTTVSGTGQIVKHVTARHGLGQPLLEGIEASLLVDVLGNLNDFSTMKIAMDRSRSWLHDKGSIRERESTGDWAGALNDYERALQAQSEPHSRSALQNGSLRCLLELGQYESILNQVSGIVHRSKLFITENERNVSSQALPIAIDAAWRLGRWDSLESLVGQFESESTAVAPGEGVQFQLQLGKAMLGLHRRSKIQVEKAVTCARDAVMTRMSTVARDSYERAYSSLVKLQCIREIEDAAVALCAKNDENDVKVPVSLSELAQSSPQGCWAWNKRHLISSNFESTLLTDVRLSLSRLAGDETLQAEIFCAMGKKARKNGLLDVASTYFSHARHIHATSTLSRKSIEVMGNIQMQIAKLEYERGRSGFALSMLGVEDVSIAWGRLSSNELRLEAASRLQLITGRPSSASDPEVLKDLAKRLLKSTRWIAEGGLKPVSEVMSGFRLANKLYPRWEKSHFEFGKYLHSVLEARISGIAQHEGLSAEDEAVREYALSADINCQNYLYMAMEQYLSALSVNSNHVYQALPRFLSLWFEYTAIEKMSKKYNRDNVGMDTPVKLSSDPSGFLRRKKEEANKLFSSFSSKIPSSAFYTALPQLIARLCHPNSDTRTSVKSLLVRVLARFPAQALWSLAWVRNSIDKTRSQIGREIFSSAQKRIGASDRKLDPFSRRSREKSHNLLAASQKLVLHLIDIAKHIPKDDKVRSFKLARWKGEALLSDFLPPIQSVLSTPVESTRGTDQFPRLRAFHAQVQIMSSKAKPKRVKFYVVPAAHGTLSSPGLDLAPAEEDIGELHFLVKNEAKGDLRKDARVQDLNNVINRLMATAGKKKRQRRLHLRTFAVTCLSEDCGIVEWVPNTESFRSLVSKTYNPQAAAFSQKRRGKRIAQFADPSLRRNYEAVQDHFFKNGDLTRAAHLFEVHFLNSYPPLFYWWFVQTFLDPHTWYEARTNFTTSAAVWSAVGHVIGLGDRHSENLLIDTATGGCVHVDFDCIFDKGLTLPKPEIIPFRLTPNMIDAFGPVGADGLYAESLRTAMTVLRDNRDTLLSVLEPFVKDPVIDWKKSSRSQDSSNQESVRDTAQARRSIKVIDERLKGVYNLRNPNFKRVVRTDQADVDPDDDVSQIIPLSVEGQVQKMISEATSHENLVQLYLGWMSWI